MIRIRIEYNKQYYLKNRDKLRKNQKEWYENNKDKARVNRLSRRERCIKFYGGDPPKCECCGESIYEFLTIDHINGGGNKHRESMPSKSYIYEWLLRNDFPDGFRVLCYNCNCSSGHYGVCPHKTLQESLDMV